MQLALLMKPILGLTMPDFTSHNLLLFTESLHLIKHSFLKDFTEGTVVS